MSPDGIITTFAGNGISDDSGDGGLATDASFRTLSGLAVGPDDSVFVLDPIARRVRKIAQGTIMAFAGSAPTGFVAPADGQPALQAQLTGATGIAADQQGNVYVAQGIIRRVGLDGTITTIAGKGSAIGDDGDALTTMMTAASLAIDSSGNIYLYDSNTFMRDPSAGPARIVTAVRMIDSSGTIHHIASVSGITGMALSPTGLIAVSSGSVQQVSAIDSVATIAGAPDIGFSGDGAPATSATLSRPAGVAVSSAGDVYFSDAGNARLRRIDAGGIITTVAGDGFAGNSGDGGPATSARFGSVGGVAVDSMSNLYVTDALANRVRKIDSQGTISTVAGGNTGTVASFPQPATSLYLPQPFQVSVDSAGNLFILDAAHLVKRVSAPDQSVLAVTGGGRQIFSSVPNGPSSNDIAMTTDSNDNLFILYSTNGSDAKVVKFAPSGQATAIDWVSAIPANANSIAVDTAGAIYIGSNATIRKFTPDGKALTLTGSSEAIDILQDGPAYQAIEGAAALATGSDGYLYIADSWYDRIRRVNGSACTVNTTHESRPLRRTVSSEIGK